MWSRNPVRNPESSPLRSSVHSLNRKEMTMTPPAGIARMIAASVSLCLVLTGCETTASMMSKVQGSKMHAAADKVKADPEAVENAFVRMKTTSAKKRDYWKDKTFEEFERSVYREPWSGGKYIVDGDTPIADKKQLQEF